MPAKSRFEYITKPNAMLPAFHESPPTREIQGGLGSKHGHAGAKPESLSQHFALDLGKKHIGGLESRRQHLHWGLTSATGLRMFPERFGHRQSREHLQGWRQHESFRHWDES